MRVMWLNERIESFLKKKKKEIKTLGEHYPEKKSLVLDYEELERFDHGLAEQLTSEPDETIDTFEAVLNGMDVLTLEEKPSFHVRFTNLPKEPGYTLLVREITSEYIGKLIAVEGVVNKIGDVLPKVSKAIFICNRCGERHLEDQETRFLQEPIKCTNCERREFRFVPDDSEFIDIQRLEIQEPMELLKGGEQARRIELWAEDDLTDVVTAGDKIMVVGTVRLIPPKQRGSVYYKYVEANHIMAIEQEFEEIEITEEEEKEILELAKDPHIHEKIINSIAPSIYGYREVKEAIALQLFGGRYGKKLPDKTSVRPDIHLLLIGDPGVAKSKFLQYVDRIAPRSIYVSGKGTTSAGLTATAEKDEFAEGAWVLKAGALVLAGGGIAAIDEFNEIGRDDRSSMHEAMEQQTISVAKAGIIAKFKANTSVLAAANPKFSRFDTYKPPGEQFDIPPTLLSRFDLIFPIRDILDREQDRSIADHIMKMHMSEEDMEGIQPEIQSELFMKYIAYARKNINPQLTEDTSEKLKEYYVTLRSSARGGSVPATPRQLEALIRLAESSAKMRLSNDVSVADVERAINLTKFVLRAVAYDEATGEFDIDRIVTDHPKSVRDQIRIVEDIVQTLISETAGSMASREDIISAAAEKKVDKFTVEKLLEELKKKGDLYEPRHGMFMLTE